MNRLRFIEIDPVDRETGEVKDADQVFLEAYHAASKNGGNGSIQKVASADRWNDLETPPSWYARKLIDKYDQAWFEWEPETIWMQIQSDFKYPVNELAKNKINAAKAVLMMDGFWREWQIFEKVVQAFNDHIPNFLSVEVPSPAEMAWAVTEAKYLNPGNVFSDEIIGYVQTGCRDVGLVYYPEDLLFAQPRPLGTLAADVKSGWEMIKGQLELEIIENELGVNLVRLQAVEVYVKEREDAR